MFTARRDTGIGFGQKRQQIRFQLRGRLLGCRFLGRDFRRFLGNRLLRGFLGFFRRRFLGNLRRLLLRRRLFRLLRRLLGCRLFSGRRRLLDFRIFGRWLLGGFLGLFRRRLLGRFLGIRRRLFRNLLRLVGGRLGRCRNALAFKIREQIVEIVLCKTMNTNDRNGHCRAEGDQVSQVRHIERCSLLTVLIL